MPSTLLVVTHPDEAGRRHLQELLEEHGCSVIACATGADTLAALDQQPAQVVITELSLADMTGVELITKVGQEWPGLPVIVLAARASVAEAVSALKQGAADFLQHPVEPEELRFVVDKALTSVERSAEQPPPPPAHQRAGILGESASMARVFATIERAAQVTATVLIRGESGTGKELVARALHEASPRATEPFVKIDCASLPENLLESEMFGYERGAFTGAITRKPGRVELADRGTLFLDEIGELTLPLQAKLLRLLQDRQFERLGGTKTLSVDVRVVAATHRNLESMVEAGQFRQDLFHRLNVVPCWLPPLRARREDIDLLVSHFLHESASRNQREGLTFTPEAQRVLRSQRWPGNVRQLANFVERLVVLVRGRVIDEAAVRDELGRTVSFVTQPGSLSAVGTPRSVRASPAAAEVGNEQVLPLLLELRAAEKGAIERALRATHHNRSLAARLLGVSRSTLYLKLKEHGLL
jgi:two-component system, NtrC family, response regulator AtoC